MFDEIANTDLSESDLPPTDADWMQIAEFALTFDGYSHCGSFDQCAEVGNRCPRLMPSGRPCLIHSLTFAPACFSSKGAGGTLVMIRMSKR
jgi:hypothetical protein